MNTPKKRIKKVTRHEWVISNGGDPITARDLSDGIFSVQRDMEALDIKIEWDDSYHVTTTDENEVILYVEVVD